MYSQWECISCRLFDVTPQCNADYRGKIFVKLDDALDQIGGERCPHLVDIQLISGWTEFTDAPSTYVPESGFFIFTLKTNHVLPKFRFHCTVKDA